MFVTTQFRVSGRCYVPVIKSKETNKRKILRYQSNREFLSDNMNFMTGKSSCLLTKRRNKRRENHN